MTELTTPCSGGHVPSALLHGRHFRVRLLTLVGVAAYAWFFKQLYIEWLEPWFAYFGFTYLEPNLTTRMLQWVLALVPLVWMPMGVRRPSVLIYWILYLVVYVPSIFVPAFLALRPTWEINLQQIVLFVSFWITGLGCKLKPLKIPVLKVSSKLFWLIFSITAILLTIWVVVAFNGRLKLVSVSDVYGQRSEANELLEKGYLAYALVFLSGFINPVLLALGIFKKKPYLFFIGTMGQLLIYSAAANKSVMASIIFIPFMALLLFKNRGSFGLVLSSSLAILLGLLYFFGKANADTQGFAFAITSLVILRTVAVPGLVMGEYAEFFATHPLTYMSHIHGVDKIIKYPYGTDIGHELGLYYTGNPEVNANANFWCTDGIAAFGVIGLLTASVACALFFWALDSSSSRVDVRFSAMIVSFTALTLANASLFTTLITGGAVLLMLFFKFMPSDGSLKALP